MREPQNIIQRLDKPMVLYLLMLLVGLMTVFAVNYNVNQSFFQSVTDAWKTDDLMFISLVWALVCSLSTATFFTKFSIPFLSS